MVYGILCTCYVVISFVILVFCVLLFVTSVGVDWPVFVTLCGISGSTLSFCYFVCGVSIVYRVLCTCCIVIGFIGIFVLSTIMYQS